MEAFILTILSIFAGIGAVHTLYYILRKNKQKYHQSGIRFMLYIPPNDRDKLEYVIRSFFIEELPEKLMAYKKLYLLTEPGDSETERLIEKLKEMYPIEVLPDQVTYCMITEKEACE